jgi:hypothetical protein
LRSKCKETKIAETSTAEYTDRRMTSRIYVHIPLFICGLGRDPFYEETYTISINGTGGLIFMATSVQPGQRIVVTNQGNDQTQECVVVSVAAQPAGSHVGFKFPTPMPQFWRGLEISKGSALRSWSEYFIETLVPLIRGDRTPVFKIDQSAIQLMHMPTLPKMLSPFVSSREDRPVPDKSGGLNGSTQR